MPTSSDRPLSHELKLDRAREHIDHLGKTIAPELHSHFLRSRYYRKTHLYVLRIAPLPKVVPLLIGDALQNLRSALDHLVYELVLKAHPQASQKVLEDSNFPIFGPRAPRTGEWNKAVGCIDQGAQALIARLQPHLLGADHVNAPLWQIHNLARIDRHRTLLVAAHAWQHGTHVVAASHASLNIIEIHQGMKEPGALVLRARAVPHTADAKVNVNHSFAVEVVFGDGPYAGRDPGKVLTDLTTAVVDQAVEPLRSYLA